MRRRWASLALAGYLDWPGVQQVCEVEREVQGSRGRRSEGRSVVSSLGAGVGPERLLELGRGHWCVGTGPARTGCTWYGM